MERKMMLHPTVCIVGRTYQIMIVSEFDALIGVRVGDRTYYHHSNGIKKSSAGVHRISVPVAELDRERRYTVIVQEMLERLPYFPKTAPAVETAYSFRPVDKTDDIHIYHLADVHGALQQAVGAAKNVPAPLDLLIMNGDISSTSDTLEDMLLVYRIASAVTGGEIPCIISRGNHDLRGFGAENLAQYMPGDHGKSYYTFRAGCIWGMLVDTGEDKEDSSEAYGGTICCHQFRIEQEEMIKDAIQHATEEYGAEGVQYKLIISHVPFTFKREEPFDIERALFSSWARLMKEHIQPDLMLCGHTHDACISGCGSEYDDLGQPCTIVVGSDVKHTSGEAFVLAGAYIRLRGRHAEVQFNTKDEMIGAHTIALQEDLT